MWPGIPYVTFDRYRVALRCRYAIGAVHRRNGKSYAGWTMCAAWFRVWHSRRPPMMRWNSSQATLWSGRVPGERDSWIGLMPSESMI